MDEFEKNEQALESPAADAPEVAAQPEPADDAADEAPVQDDALKQELEGIRDLLQQELDHAGDEPLIQALDEVQEEEPEDEEIPEDELCKCCGERRRDTSFGEDYPYCSECRDVMKASGLRVPAVLMLLLTFILAGASLYFSTLATVWRLRSILL